MHQTVRSYQ
jgi:hypothetical protein